MSVYVVGPWARASRMTPVPQTAAGVAVGSFAILFAIAMLLGAAGLARRHLRTNRADRRAAARLGIGYMIVFGVGWILGGHHSSDLMIETQQFFKMAAVCAFNAGALWVLYLAVEPYGRRFWPDGLLGWTRLFSGHVRDSRVGHDVLIGCALGGVLLLIDMLRYVGPTLVGIPSAMPGLGFSLGGLVSAGLLVQDWVQEGFNSVQSALVIVFAFVALRLLVRRTWLAVAIGVVLVAFASSGSIAPGGSLAVDALFAVLSISLITFAIFRFGLLVTAVTLLVDNIPSSIPFVASPAWASTPGYLSIALVAALCCFGFYAARGGQPLFGVMADGY
jgi:hypothetical protein